MRNLLLDILATYRLARLISLEEGPGDLLVELRSKLGAYDYSADGRPITSLGRGISCPLCVGVYIAALMLLLRGVPCAHYFKLWLAIAGGQSILQKVSE